jgi:hypothetical protein
VKRSCVVPGKNENIEFNTNAFSFVPAFILSPGGERGGVRGDFPGCSFIYFVPIGFTLCDLRSASMVLDTERGKVARG